MKKKSIIIVLAGAFTLLSGCRRTEPAAQLGPRVVTQVSVTCLDGSEQLQRHYSQDETMQGILEYLRHVEPLGASDVQFAELTRTYFEITVTCSDGHTEVYEQCANRYFRQDPGVWQSIDPEKAEALTQFIENTPSDL